MSTIQDSFSNGSVLPIEEYDCIHGFVNNVPDYIKAVSAITCILSVVGSVTIVLSYICYKDLRNKAREVIVHISLMDLMASLANFIGIAVNFDALLDKNNPHPPANRETVNNLCIAQAGFAMYETLSSILWTLAISVYFYACIMMEADKKLAKRIVTGFYVVCYGLPLLMLVWFLPSEKIGYSPVAGSGWCSLILKPNNNMRNYGENNIRLIFGGSLWIYISFVLIPVITVSLLIYIKLKIKKDAMSHQSHSRVLAVEIKLISIPIIFILLRMWSLIFTILNIRTNITSCNVIMFFLFMGGIGDSAQGFCNSLIFCLLNVKVRNAYWETLQKYTRCIHNSKKYATIQNKQESLLSRA